MDTITLATRCRGRARPGERSPALGLTAICLGFLMITLDATIVNVALGPIVADVGGSLPAAQWIVNGYTLAFAALLLSAGALADRIGARAGFLTGLAIFCLGSAACSASGSFDMLIASRVLQGVGAAWLMPCSLALIAHNFPRAHVRRRALAVWGGVSGVGLASGPVLGGVLTSTSGWRAIFLVNVPVAVIAARLVVRHVEETGRHRHPLDAVGLALAAVSLSALTGGFIVAGQRSRTSVPALALLATGLLTVIAFTLAERKVAHPMVDPVLFRRRTFAIAVTIGVIFNFCLYGSLFCLAIALHQARGLSVFDTGIAMLPMTLVTGATALLSGRGVARFGEWPVMAVGLAAGGFGAAFVAVIPAAAPTGALVLCAVPLGLTAMAMPAMSAAAMSGAPGDRIGLASGVLNAARQTGGAFGIAVLGALLATGGGAISLHLAFATIAVAYIIGILLALRGRRRIVALTGGTFAGPQLNGSLVPGASADWQIVLPDGTALGDVRYTLATDAGEVLYVRSRGVRHRSVEVLERLSRGKSVDPSEYTFRTSPQIETGAPRLDWLNEGVFVGAAGRDPSGVVYEIYLVR